MPRTVLAVLAGVALVLGLSSCKVTMSQTGPQPASSGPASPAPSSAAATPSAAPRPAADPAGRLSVLTEPQAGIGPVYRLITSARHSVDLTMYELRDPTAEAGLAADAARGVDVRVILDRNLEQWRNTGAYDYLAAQRVHGVWAPAGTTYHQKTLTIDEATSVVMTLNLVTEDYPDTRDFAVVDTDHADVAAIVATFDADFSGHAVHPPDGADLVWSPTNAEASVLAVIGGARHTLAVENEEMDDSAVTSALEAAARHGVNVTITMTADPEWDEAFSELARD